MSLIANRYGEAFFSLALSKNKIEEYKKDLEYIKESFINVDDLDKFFGSEKITKEEKKKVIADVLKDKVNKDSLNLLYVLVDKGRIINYLEIINEYRRLANNELNIKEGIVETARPIEKEKIHELEKVLSKENQKIELIPKINKTLISGFKITFEDEVIDASMKEKINKLTDVLNRKDVGLWN